MAISDIFGGMNFNIAGIMNFMIFAVGLFIAFMLVLALVFFFVIKKRKVNINLFQERSGGGSYKFVPMSGTRKYRGNSTMLRLHRLGIVDKLVPDIDQDYIYQDKSGKDTINLVMDKRGFIHKMKIPSMTDIIDFIVYKKLLLEIQTKTVGNPTPIDATIVDAIFKRRDAIKDKFIEDNPEYDIEGIPNVHETVEQINAQIKEGSKKWGGFLANYAPIILFGGTLVACIMMFTIAVIMSQRVMGG